MRLTLRAFPWYTDWDLPWAPVQLELELNGFLAVIKSYLHTIPSPK